jgi:hypothetical protein
MITPSYETAVTEPDSDSGVSWSAVLAGAAAAAALSLILLLLGFGLGFSAISPWANEGVSAKGLGISSIVWLAITQLLAAGLGGYIAGRLRVKWASVHTDEVYFRDTAHGFLAWAIATLVTATLLVGTVSGIVGTGLQAGASVAAGAATAASQASASQADGAGDAEGYFIDTLFRDSRPVPVTDDAAHPVVARIFAKSLANDGQLSKPDRDYLAQVVSQRTDLTFEQAQARVDQVYADAHKAAQEAKVAAQQAADAARKAAAHAALWMFVALLIGAFVGSFSATLGGRQRDAVVYLSTETGRTVPAR